MEMIFEWVKLGLSVLSFIASIAMFIYIRADRQQRATVKSIVELKESVDKRFSAKCERLSKLESEINRIPSRAEFDSAQRRTEGYIKGIYDRINEIEKANQESARETNLLLGQVLGQLKHLSKE